MRRRRVLPALLSIFIFLAILSGKDMEVTAADGTNANRMNVVFVLDQSGSMYKTDRAGLRYDAMDLFLGLATEDGNYMGAVVFNEEIALQKDIIPLNGRDNKNALSQSIRAVSCQGDTDIGKAIEVAARMLKESGNPELASAIILLSDGNTDLGGDHAGLKTSLESRENAIGIARENDCKIYSICLNADGTADTAELEELSDATGGTCVAVEGAEDLKAVFNQFYDMIYSTETIELGQLIIPQSGKAEVAFDIPGIGVEEANIIISTLHADTSYRLFRPDGTAYTKAELDRMKITASTFSVLKIQNPDSGQWKLIVEGIPGDNVTIEMVCNLDLALAQTIDRDERQDVLITAQLSNMGVTITEEEIYKQYPIYVVIASAGTDESEEYKMAIQNGRAEYVLVSSPETEYEIYSYCDVDGIRVTSQKEQVQTRQETQRNESVEGESIISRKWIEIQQIVPAVLAGVVVIVIMGLIISIIRKTNLLIRGRLHIIPFYDGVTYTAETYDGVKGKMRFDRYIHIREDVGIDRRHTYFIHGETNDCIYLVSKKGYYTDTDPDRRSRRIRLDGEMPVEISNDMEFFRGIKVTYIPDDIR